jgi:hypothetical protein
LYFPDPVFLNRFAAALHVLILGILTSPVLQFTKKIEGGIEYIPPYLPYVF